MTTDPVMPVREQLLQAVNSKYKKNLALEHVSFGVPQILDLPGSPHNTQVEITGVEGQPYEFTTVLQFTRLLLEDAFFGRSRAFDGVITHTHDLVEAIALRLGLPITDEDLVGHPIESTSYPQFVLLAADPRSLLLHGQVRLELTGP